MLGKRKGVEEPRADKPSDEQWAATRRWLDCKIRPVAHTRLTPSQFLLWPIVVDSCEQSAEWTNADKILAAQLVRTISDIARVQDQLTELGEPWLNERKTKPHPLRQLLDTLLSRQTAQMRLLMCHPAARFDRNDLDPRRKAEAQARETFANAKNSDGLLQ